MFKSTKPCLCEETNGSYSYTVLGILLITVSLSMGLSVLGVWVNAFDGSQEDTFDLPLIPEKKTLEDIISKDDSSQFKNFGDQSTEINSAGLSLECSEDEFSDEAISGLCDVSVPECGSFGPYDTETGTMEIVGMTLPTDPLPLCIDNDYLMPFEIIVRTTGGYVPDGGWICVYQGFGDKEEFKGKILIRSDLGTPVAEVCGATDYVLTFYVCDPIILESNHIPDSPLGDFCVWSDYDDLQKEVYLCVHSIWEGCFLDEQEFMVILAHKAMSQNPKLPICNTSPVKS